MLEKILSTIPEAAEILSLGKTKVWELVYQGELECVRIGRSVRIPTSALDTFVERLREEARHAGA